MAALVVSGAASSSAGVRQRVLRGSSFRSTVDATFKVVAHRGGPGSQTWSLSSTGAPLDADGIPRAGAIGLTLTESTPPAGSGRGREAAGESRAGQTSPQPRSESPAKRDRERAEAAIALMSRIVRAPPGAEGVQISGQPQFLTLAGASAAEESYEYVYRRHGNVQIDVVARRGGEVYFIELDTALPRLAQGEAALARLLRGWHWT